jgi:hypothetical protein
VNSPTWESWPRGYSRRHGQETSGRRPDLGGDGVAELGVAVIPWERAVEREFDLAITANHSGGLQRLRAPVVIVSHGVGYCRRAPRGPEYGMSPQSLPHKGKLVADTLVITHEEQVARLAATALPAAYVAGDPCFDRIEASAGRRSAFRAALGCDDDAELIVFSSTWRSGSAFGAWPTFLRQLLAAANAKWPDVRDLVSSRPGEAGSRLRSLFYQRLGLSEPDSHPAESPLSSSRPGPMTWRRCSTRRPAAGSSCRQPPGSRPFGAWTGPSACATATR